MFLFGENLTLYEKIIGIKRMPHPVVEVVIVSNIGYKIQNYYIQIKLLSSF